MLPFMISSAEHSTSWYMTYWANGNETQNIGWKKKEKKSKPFVATGIEPDPPLSDVLSFRGAAITPRYSPS